MYVYDRLYPYATNLNTTLSRKYIYFKALFQENLINNLESLYLGIFAMS